MTRRDVDPRDVQALARSGFGSLNGATYLLWRVGDLDQARSFLHQLMPTSMADLATGGTGHHVAEAIQVAFTASGLRALGTPTNIVERFAPEFVEGMADSRDRSLRLGDVGANAPGGWDWGYGKREPHVLVMIFARPDQLEAVVVDLRTRSRDSGLIEIAVLPTADMGGVEPFGFADGVSQPTFDWDVPRSPGGKADRRYTNLIALGELLLGYRNEYGYFPATPTFAATEPDADALALAAHPIDARDLGRNGSYLVYRQLAQDVRGFWRWVAAEAERVGVTRETLAEAMVGRQMGGMPLADLERGRILPGVNPMDRERNGFLFDVDPDGLTCPIGAHIRRANPRTGDMLAGDAGILDPFLTTLGLTMRRQRRPTASTLPWPRNTTVWPYQRSRDDAISSARFHRILRRGREYGAKIDIEAALDPQTPDPRAGLHFICLNANLSRQFEFIQGAWLANAKFAGLTNEQDPLVGNREPFPTPPIVGEPVATDEFSRPGAEPRFRYARGLPQLVAVRGGAYFFLPGLAAYRWLTRG
jgi:deferrochelatase/peroxidase EfeB